MSQVQVGSVVKSFDFPHVDDCYMVGLVVEVDGDLMVCEMVKQVFKGQVDPSPASKFRASVNGRVVVLD